MRWEQLFWAESIPSLAGARTCSAQVSPCSGTVTPFLGRELVSGGEGRAGRSGVAGEGSLVLLWGWSLGFSAPYRTLPLFSQELKGFNSLDDLLHVKGITTRILELNSQRMTCRRRPSSEDAARVSPTLQGDGKAPVPQVGEERWSSACCGGDPASSGVGIGVGYLTPGGVGAGGGRGRVCSRRWKREAQGSLRPLKQPSGLSTGSLQGGSLC